MSKLTRNEISKYLEEKIQLKVNYELPSLLFKDSLYAFETCEDYDDINAQITEDVIKKADENYTVFCGIFDESKVSNLYKMFLFDKEDNILYLELNGKAENSSYLREVMIKLDDLDVAVCLNKWFEINDYEALDKFIAEKISLEYISSEKVHILEKIDDSDINGSSLSEAFEDSVECFVENGDVFDHLDIEDDITEEQAKKIKELDEKYVAFTGTFSGDYYQIFVADKDHNIYVVGYNHDFVAEMRYNMLNWFEYDEKLEIYSSTILSHYFSNLSDQIW